MHRVVHVLVAVIIVITMAVFMTPHWHEQTADGHGDNEHADDLAGGF
jgi:hypothetical protein